MRDSRQRDCLRAKKDPHSISVFVVFQAQLFQDRVQRSVFSFVKSPDARNMCLEVHLKDTHSLAAKYQANPTTGIPNEERQSTNVAAQVLLPGICMISDQWIKISPWTVLALVLPEPSTELESDLGKCK
jgi:hypothetical protein